MHAIADTHALVWYRLNDPRLSPAAKAAFTMAAAQGQLELFLYKPAKHSGNGPQIFGQVKCAWPIPGMLSSPPRNL